ncbi:amidase [Roseomonas terrae]|jgi:Asp-tRNA(Asn)/Glu-tRNA(Gln) amidotransferase A subunit family amidase|uniref:Amidase n=1 Tax=Neoroseomonas terrae TaxID=424799 RepID=A0ABS5EQ44_9PROT|nr:amidase [Neoroseomonas terrae]MBR0653122.1 amidase [Neoroseomonas terrae]
MTDTADLTATDALAAIRAGRLTAAAYREACLDRIAAREPVIRAFAWFDADLVRRAPAGEGPLAGMPMGVKDVLDTADMPSQYGSPAWAGHRPRSDAACVAAARAAGATIIGKTVTTEFATRHPGPTANPANPKHTPGGSSSGSAAGVAAGFFPVAFGTQTAGSIVRPAAYCGVVGFKPSYGTLHRGGMKVMSESLDTIGVMARSVADCALAMGAMSGLDFGAPDAKAARAPRLALVMGPTADQAAPETVALLERAAEACRRAGATVTPVTLPAVFQAGYDAHPYVMNMESAEALGWELADARAQISGVLQERLDWGRSQPRGTLVEARAAFAAARAALPAAIEGFDAVLCPSAPGEAPEGLGWTGDPAFNSLWTLLHGPCVTVPAGAGPKGLPLGVQLAGRIGDDAAVLGWARWVQAAL